MQIELHIHEIDVFIKGLTAIGGGAPKYLDAVLWRCMNLDVWPLWIKQISLSDHTLEELRRLGHPYSKIYGKDSFVHPDDVVHIQDGGLLGGSKIEKSKDGLGWQLINDAPEYIQLRYGTKYMRIRDPGGAALFYALPLIKKRFGDEVKGAIIQILTKA
jgi:hypothetical protein